MQKVQFGFRRPSEKLDDEILSNIYVNENKVIGLYLTYHLKLNQGNQNALQTMS